MSGGTWTQCRGTSSSWRFLLELLFVNVVYKYNYKGTWLTLLRNNIKLNTIHHLESYLDDVVGSFVSSRSLQLQPGCMFSCFKSLHSDGLKTQQTLCDTTLKHLFTRQWTRNFSDVPRDCWTWSSTSLCFQTFQSTSWRSRWSSSPCWRSASRRTFPARPEGVKPR